MFNFHLFLSILKYVSSSTNIKQYINYTYVEHKINVRWNSPLYITLVLKKGEEKRKKERTHKAWTCWYRRPHQEMKEKHA